MFVTLRQSSELGTIPCASMDRAPTKSLPSMNKSTTTISQLTSPTIIDQTLKAAQLLVALANSGTPTSWGVMVILSPGLRSHTGHRPNSPRGATQLNREERWPPARSGTFANNRTNYLARPHTTGRHETLWTRCASRDSKGNIASSQLSCSEERWPCHLPVYV